MDGQIKIDEPVKNEPSRPEISLGAHLWIIFITNTVITLIIIGAVAAVFYVNRAKIENYVHPATTALSEAQAHDQVVISAVQKANPAVVSIIISKEVPVMKEYTQNEQVPDPFDMFGGGGGFTIQVPQYEQDGTQEQEVGGGSGFFVAADGLIATNDHVVSDSGAEYTVYTNDGQEHPAKVVAQDSADDIAFIKIDGSGYPFLTFDDSNSLQLGQSVIAIGNALGEFRNTVSVGVVSGLSRSITAGEGDGSSEESLSEVIQTDAAINPGNSGGALVNVRGELVGINTALFSPNGGSNGIGFAIPVNLARGVTQQLVSYGRVLRGWLGVEPQDITPELAQAFRLQNTSGFIITDVAPASPAAEVGLAPGDVIEAIDGGQVENSREALNRIAGKAPGTTITVSGIHKGKHFNLKVTVAERPVQRSS